VEYLKGKLGVGDLKELYTWDEQSKQEILQVLKDTGSDEFR